MLKTLIVEDERIIRTNIIKSIDWNAEGCLVPTEARTAEEGLEAIAASSPEIILTDINLPGINGIEMLEKARDMGFFFEAVIITGYGQFDYAKRAIGLEAVDYILKPIDEQKLLEAIRKAAGNVNDKRAIVRLKAAEKPVFALDKVCAGTSDPYVLRVLELIRQRYRTTFTIDDAGSLVGLSSGYLSRKLKEETGMSFLELLHRHRVEVALDLIKKDRSLKYYEIAEKTGFSSYKRFSQVFRDICGYAPRDVAKDHEED